MRNEPVRARAKGRRRGWPKRSHHSDAHVDGNVRANVTAFPSDAASSVTSTRYVIVRNTDRASRTWTPTHPICPPHRQKIVASRGPLSHGGTYTYCHRGCITDDGHRTIPTAAIVPIHPALDLPLCALLIAHRQDERVLIPSPLPTVKKCNLDGISPRLRQMRPDHHRRGRIEEIAPRCPRTALPSPRQRPRRIPPSRPRLFAVIAATALEYSPRPASHGAVILPIRFTSP